MKRRLLLLMVVSWPVIAIGTGLACFVVFGSSLEDLRDRYQWAMGQWQERIVADDAAHRDLEARVLRLQTEVSNRLDGLECREAQLYGGSEACAARPEAPGVSAPPR